MPLIETLTLLASLGSALQGIRTNKPEERAVNTNGTSTTLLLSYEYVKTSQDRASQENASLNGRLQTMLIAAGAIVAGASVLAPEAGEVDSPFYIAALVVFGVIALMVGLLVTARPLFITAQDVVSGQAAQGEVEFLRDMLAEAGRFERDNRKLMAMKAALLGVLYVCFAVLSILLGVWAVEG